MILPESDRSVTRRTTHATDQEGGHDPSLALSLARGTPGRRSFATPLVWLAACGVMIGCGGPKPPTPPIPDHGPEVRIGPADRSETGPRTFAAGEPIAPASLAFEGGPGFVRVTLEVETVAGGDRTTSLNDVLFAAEGNGTITVEFRGPRSGHESGRVSVRCVSGAEESVADFEPGLWFGDPGASVGFESPIGKGIMVKSGSEVVLARYHARSAGREVRLAVKAVFAGGPVAPRTQVGKKAPG